MKELAEFPMYPIFGQTYKINGVKWVCLQNSGWVKVRVNTLTWSELDAAGEEGQIA